MNDNYTITVRHPLLKKAVGWLEKRSKPVRALIFTTVSFAVGVFFVAFGATIYTFFGLVPLLLAILFFVVWGYILMEMD